MPDTQSGTNFYCVGYNVIQFTKEEIETLRTNPNVKQVRENRLDLTYAFRLELYDAWKEKPRARTIKEMLVEHGIDLHHRAKDFVHRMARNFKNSGRPSNGKKGIVSSRHAPSNSDELLATGKFVKKGNGISFSAEFESELYSKYPEQTIEDGIRNAGIDPDAVGYYRIYMLERKFLGLRNGVCTKVEDHPIYTDADIAIISMHPYVKRIAVNRLQFHDCFYSEASVILESGSSLKDILTTFELHEEWLSQSSQETLYYKIRKTKANTQKPELDMTDWPPEKTAQYIRIQRKRVAILENMVHHHFEELRERIPGLDQLQKKSVCEWIRDDVLPLSQTPGCENSLPNVLSKLKISRSVYYRLLKEDGLEKRMAAKQAQKEEDMEAIRRVIEYHGFGKGARQVYMQLPILEKRRMGIHKVRKLMKEMNLQSQIRRPKSSLKSARLRLSTHVKPNLLKRTFKLHRPGKVMLTDVTFLKYHHGSKLAYASALIDSVTGKLYEMNASEFNNLDLVLGTMNALPNSSEDADGEQPMLHSDQGALYLTDVFQELLIELGYQQSMSKRGNCCDNAPQESFFGHFKDEVSYKDLETLEELEAVLQDYKKYYNEIRGQWNRDRMTPLQREAWINNMSNMEFEEWQKKERERYEEMKRLARERAIERSRTLGV